MLLIMQRSKLPGSDTQAFLRAAFVTRPIQRERLAAHNAVRCCDGSGISTGPSLLRTAVVKAFEAVFVRALFGAVRAVTLQTALYSVFGSAALADIL